MNKKLEKYLDTVDKCLKPLPASERVDIVKEVKSSIMEMEQEGMDPEQILERLGSPKALAKAYLSDLLTKGVGGGWKRFLIICAFYSLTGFSGLFVIPVLGICAPVFLACGAVCPILGIVKLVDGLFHLNIPGVQYIQIVWGSDAFGPVGVFVASILIGVLLFLLGWGCWKLLLLYLKGVGSTKHRLEV